MAQQYIHDVLFGEKWYKICVLYDPIITFKNMNTHIHIHTIEKI